MRFLFPCGFWQTNHLSEYIGCSRTKASIMIISLYYCKIDVFLLPLLRPSFLMTLLSLLVHSSSINTSFVSIPTHLMPWSMIQSAADGSRYVKLFLMVSSFLHLSHTCLQKENIVFFDYFRIIIKVNICNSIANRYV